MMLTKLRERNVLTIPATIVKQLNLQPGDEIEVSLDGHGSIRLTPVIVIPREQAWFYTKEWQADEREVELQIREGRISVARNKEELVKDLGLDDL